MHRDCGWRTSLGTCFYDRLLEAEELGRVAREGWSVLVVGPRNVGKSELVRYALSKRLGVKPVVLDARALVVRGEVEKAVREAGRLSKARVAQVLVRVAADGLGLGGVIDALLDLLRSARAEPYIVIDEFSYLGDFTRSRSASILLLSSRGTRILRTSLNHRHHCIHALIPR